MDGSNGERNFCLRNIISLLYGHCLINCVITFQDIKAVPFSLLPSPTDDSSYGDFHRTSSTFFTYFTPVILTVGLVGNIISLLVFRSSGMRKMSASLYLVSLALVDICVLVGYVLPEWIKHGVANNSPNTSFVFLEVNGVCQLRMFLAYFSRMASSWIIVAFTVERFTGVCYPLKSLQRHPMKILVGLTLACCVLVMYKPFLSRPVTHRGGFVICSSMKEYQYEIFIVESLYVVSIFFVPLVIISVLNGSIMRTLFLRNTQTGILTDSTNIRMEFTVILFAISLCYAAFHLPYYIVWCRLQIVTNPKSFVSRNSDFWDYWKGVLNLVRPIYYLNYCSNFFLYCITGAYFRSELARILCCRDQRRHRYRTHIRASRMESLTRQSHLSATNGTENYATYTA